MAGKSPSGKGPSAWQTNRLAIKSLRGLVPLERLLLLELNDWASPDAPDPLRPIVWRPHAMLAQDLEVSRSAITRALAALCRKGCAELMERKRQHRAARYRLLVHSPVVRPCTTEPESRNANRNAKVSGASVESSGADQALQWCASGPDDLRDPSDNRTKELPRKERAFCVSEKTLETDQRRLVCMECPFTGDGPQGTQHRRETHHDLRWEQMGV